jgi:hypothetical protein
LRSTDPKPIAISERPASRRPFCFCQSILKRGGDGSRQEQRVIEAGL